MFDVATVGFLLMMFHEIGFFSTLKYFIDLGNILIEIFSGSTF